ncbi:wax ester/triacylglycerol synthase family O-acyltransferase [Pseudomonadales bacterium]|nr:wax ester/triacylglycerol synthase family O-acyltransferase [Pseudomonadales bacterium]
MEQIGALDANFLYTETNSVHNHIASIQILELPVGQTSKDFIEGLRQVISDRRHLVPYLTRKLRYTPMNMDHPFWVEDKQFNIDNHIYEVPLETADTSDAGFSKLQEKIAELHAVPMDRSKPLWSMQVITGFADRKIAYYNQTHHVCIDGVSGQLALAMLMDPSAEVRQFEQTANAGTKDSVQSGNLEMLIQSAENLISFQADNQHRLLGQIESSVRLGQRTIDPSKQLGALMEPAPETRFNKTIGSSRSYTAGQISLADVKRIGKALDCKVNDVFLSVAAGGLRTYLERKGELPDKSLIAGCPVSLRPPGDDSLCNQVTMMKVDLATHLADPSLRLLAIRDSALTAKEVTADLSHGLTTNVSLAGLPALTIAAARIAEATSAADYMPPPINVLISNVPGPKQKLYSNGAEMLTHYPVSIPAHGNGVNITVQSYVDELYFAVTACQKALPDPDQLRKDIYAAFEKLKALLIPEKAVTASVSELTRKPATDAEKVGNDTTKMPYKNQDTATLVEKVA